MTIIDHYPTPHETVEFSVASTVVNGVASIVKVTLRSVGVLADPVTFVTDNSLEQEILSKGGFCEALEVDWVNGTLDSTTSSGQSYMIYVILYDVTGTGC